MANTINMNLSLNATGIREANRDAAALANNLERANRATSTAGSRRAASMGASPAAMARNENQEYNRGRGAMGSTGASARDFANQAQGLGGLVRVYATFAANIFAATAAFGALSKAADTTNLIKGLDQLGAASGRSLGSLANSLVKATDGAISLREAMQATALTSSAGFTSSQITRMATAANKASLALGVSMPDAMSRLSRGITKLEPELLDELGIMVRVDTATQAYAKSLGRSAASLTDFEKRQAFANAVLTQAEEKFGAINIDSNPYTKLAASLSNIAQSGLELINKVLGPVVKLLSESPVALGAAIAYIGKTLISLAIPALGEWKTGIKNSADAARKASNDILSSFGDNWQTKLENRFNLPKLQQSLADAQVRFGTMAAELPKKLGKTKAVSELLGSAGDAEDIYAKKISKVDSLIKARTDSILAEKGKIENVNKAKIAGLEKEIIALQRLKAETDALRLAKKQLDEGNRGSQDVADKPPGFFSEESARTRIATAARNRASSLEALSNVSSNTARYGLGDAIDKLNSDVLEKNLKGWQRWKTVAVGSIIAVGTSAALLAESLQGYFAIIALVIGVASGIYSFFATSGKASENFGEKLNRLEDSVKSFDNTKEAVLAKNPSKFFSIEAIEAQATALNELADSLTGLADSFNKLNKSRNIAEVGVEKIFELFNSGDIDKLGKNMSNTMSRALESLSDPELKEEAKARIADILGISVASLTDEAVSKNIANSGYDLAEKKVRRLAEIVEDFSKKSSAAVAPLTELKSSLSETSKQVDAINASLTVNDPMGKLGATLIATSFKISKAFTNSKTAILALNEVAKNTQLMSVLDKSTITPLLEDARKITDATRQLSIAKKSLIDAEAKQQEATKNGKRNSIKDVIKQEVENARATVKELEGVASNLVIKNSRNLADAVFVSGIKLMEGALKVSMQEAGIIAAKAYLGVLKSAGLSTASEEAKIARQELDIQRKQLQLQYDSLLKLEANTIATDRLTLQLEREAIQSDLNSTSEARISKAVEKLGKLSERENVLNAKEQLLNSKNPKELEQKYLNGSDTDRTAVEEMKSLIPALYAFKAGMAKINAQGFAINLGEQAGKIDERAKSSLKPLEERDKAVKASQDELKIRQEILGTLDSEGLLQQRLNEAEIANISRERSSIEYSRKYELLQLAYYNTKDKLKQDEILAEAERLGQLEEQDKKLYDIAAKQREVSEAVARSKMSLEKETAERTHLQKLASIDIDLASSKLEYNIEQLEILKQLGVLEESAYITRKNALELSKLESDKISGQDNLYNDYKSKEASLLSQLALAESMGIQNTQAEEQLKRLTEEYLKQSSALNTINARKVESANKSAQIAIELAKQKEVMDSMKNTTQALADLFGEMGENIGKAAEAMLELSQNTANRKRAEEALSKDPKATATEIEKLRKKNAKDELADISKTAAATKKMFGEKTAAYKIIQGVERAAHAERQALQVMEAVETAKNVGKQISAAMDYMATLKNMTFQDAINAIVKQGTGGDPWSAIPRMVAMASFVSSLIGEDVSGSAPAVSSEQMQKAQLTGQYYDASGNLVNSGYGALGDPTANVKGMTDAIDTLGKIFFNNMGNRSSALLMHLKAIQENTGETVAALINSGSNAGGTGIGPNVSLPADSVFGPGQGIPIIGGILNSLFGGGSSSSNVESQSLRIRSTNLESLAAGQIAGYFDTLVKTVREESWLFFKSTSISYSRQYANLNSTVLSKIQTIFQAFNASMYEVSKGLGGSAQEMTNVLRSVSGNIDMEIKGMSGSQIGEALGAQLTLKMNEVIAKAFPWIRALTKTGEEFTAAAARLIKADETMQTAFSLIGQSLMGPTTEVRMTRQQNLLRLYGGSLDDFVTAVQSYYDAFFTDADKLAARYTVIRETLSVFGLSAIRTEAQFKDLVSSLDLTTQYGQEMFKTLMDLAPAFSEVSQAIASVVNERNGLLEQMYQLTGNSALATQMKRSQTLKDLDPVNRKLQEYVWALEDLKTAEDKLAAARRKTNNATINAINSTVSTLEGFIKSLATFRDSLKLSVQSPLTPQEKYAEARSQLDALLQVINTNVAPGSEQEKLRNDAVNKFQNLATTFLDVSKAYNASSAQYVADYNMIQSALVSAESILSAQLSDAEIQQSQLQAILDAEDATTNATLTVAEGVSNLNDKMAIVANALNAWLLSDINTTGYGQDVLAAAGIQQFANGGYASGVALVGERGPELVNFTNPAQVYTAEQTAGMFGTNMQLVEEVRQLRAEVQKLREQQNRETGAIITATFDAQNRNANTVAEAVEEAAKTQIWNAKVQQSVVLV